MSKRTREREHLPRLGLDQAIRSTARQALADFELRSIVYSAILVRAVVDIIERSFYEKSIDELLGAVPGYLSWISDISAELGAHLSPGFSRCLEEPLMDELVAIAAKYYLSRAPLLTTHIGTPDLPPDRGPSPEDCRAVVRMVSLQLEDWFPDAWEILKREDPDQWSSIFGSVAVGRSIAEKHQPRAPEYEEFANGWSLWTDRVVAATRVRGLSPNMIICLKAVLDRRRRIWWSDYSGAYRNMLAHWLMADSFEGLGREPMSSLWDDLAAKLEARDWIVRAGVGWP